MRPSLYGAAAVCALAVAAPREAAGQTRMFDLRAQSAVTAIPEFARQARLQVIAPADDLREFRTPAIRGAGDARVVLQRLIAGSGLSIARDDGATIVLHRPALLMRVPLDRSPARPTVLDPEPLPTVNLETLVVFGRGQTRQVQFVRASEEDRAPAGSSPLALVEKLPSVNYETSDPFGTNEWSVRISIRGFSQGRLGFTLDDVPLGDMTYGNHNGLHASRAITTENLDSVALAQGPGSLDAASSSNLGGTIKFVSHDPAYEPGGLAVLGGGSDQTLRSFLRVETGELPSGLRAYASYAYNTTERWQGAGRQYVQQANLKAVQPLGDGSVTGFVNLSRRRESDPQDLSLEMIHRLGLGWDNIPKDWPLAVRLAEIGNNRGDTKVPGQHPEFGTEYPAPIASVDDAYYDSTTARDDALAALTFRQNVGERLSLKSTVYAHWDKGQGLWWTPYVPSPNYAVAGATVDDAPISIRSTEYDIRRRGVLGSASMRLGSHLIDAGAWLEENDFVQARRYYGLNRAAPQRDYTEFQKGAFLTDWAYHFTTRTRQFHVQDTWNASEELTVTAGFKSLSVSNHAATLAGPEKSGSIEASRSFLPQAGFSLRLTPASELFGDYGRGMRAFQASNTSGPFATTQEAFNVIRERLKPEISDSFEIGWRATTGDLTLLLAAYTVKFHNRLFSTPVGQGILGNPTAIANVGGVKSYGFESAASWRVSRDWSLYGSYAYGKASYDNDVYNGDGVEIADIWANSAVDAPHHVFKGRVNYRKGAVFARLGGSYVSRRYFTYENDQSVDPHFVADLSVGYAFSGSPLLDGLEAQLNVTNLFDARYVSTLGSNDFPLRGDAQTLLSGPPRQVFVLVRKTF